MSKYKRYLVQISQKNTYKGMRPKKLTKLELEAVKFACSTIMADGGTAYEAFYKDKNKMINALIRAESKPVSYTHLTLPTKRIV